MSESVKDKAESIRQRLRNLLRERGEDVQFGLQRYAIERFLYRLGVSGHRERFVLKGAALFALWGGPLYRPTRDLDFTGYGSANETDVLAALHEICLVSNPGDALVFDPDTLSAEPIRDDSEYSGLRIRLAATLATSRIPIQIDIGFGNAVEPPPQYAEFPTLLDDPVPRIRTYPPEAVIAEKLHAMVMLGERNSRIKDFYDLYVLAHEFPFAGEQLTSAIAATFKRRNTPIDLTQPVALAPRFYADTARATQWRTYLERNHLPGAPSDFDSVGELIRQFLGPVWSVLAGNVTFASLWRPGGAWNSEDSENKILAAVSGPASPTSHGQRHSGNANTAHIEDIEIPIATPLRRFKPYPAYKDSGVEWLGKIPAHWEVIPLKRIASIRYGLGEPPQELADGLPFIRATNVMKGRIVDREMQFVDPSDVPWNRDPVLRVDDIIVVRSGAYTGDSAIIPPEYDGAIAGYDMVVRSHSCRVRFLGWALLSRYVLEAQIELESMRAAQPHLNAEELGAVVLMIPPDSEQRHIAAFLDRETAKIDALVAKKERLIELLQEKRAALISRAVTKGFDPNVSMKTSGVEWLGEIPTHWEVWRLKHVSGGLTVGVVVNPSHYVSVSGVPFLRGVDVIEERILLDRVQYMSEDSNRVHHKSVLRAGDLVSIRVGYPGVTAVVPEELDGSNCASLLITRRSPRVDSLFLCYLMNSAVGKAQFKMLQDGAAQEQINVSDAVDFLVPLPPKNEQAFIVQRLAAASSRIDSLIANVQDGIDRLKEFRTALISAAVTGKIDVREGVV